MEVRKPAKRARRRSAVVGLDLEDDSLLRRSFQRLQGYSCLSFNFDDDLLVVCDDASWSCSVFFSESSIRPHGTQEMVHALARQRRFQLIDV